MHRRKPGSGRKPVMPAGDHTFCVRRKYAKTHQGGGRFRISPPSLDPPLIQTGQGVGSLTILLRSGWPLLLFFLSCFGRLLRACLLKVFFILYTICIMKNGFESPPRLASTAAGAAGQAGHNRNRYKIITLNCPLSPVTCHLSSAGRSVRFSVAINFEKIYNMGANFPHRIRLYR